MSEQSFRSQASCGHSPHSDETGRGHFELIVSRQLAYFTNCASLSTH